MFSTCVDGVSTWCNTRGNKGGAASPALLVVPMLCDEVTGARCVADDILSDACGDGDMLPSCIVGAADVVVMVGLDAILLDELAVVCMAGAVVVINGVVLPVVVAARPRGGIQGMALLPVLTDVTVHAVVDAVVVVL